MIGVKINAPGGKGPCGGRAGCEGKREGMVGKDRSNDPAGFVRRPVQRNGAVEATGGEVRQLQRGYGHGPSGPREGASTRCTTTSGGVTSCGRRGGGCEEPGRGGRRCTDARRGGAVRRRALPRRAQACAARRQVPGCGGAAGTFRRQMEGSGRWASRRSVTGCARWRRSSCWSRYSRRTFLVARTASGRSGRRWRLLSAFGSRSARPGVGLRRRHPRLLRVDRPREADEARGRRVSDRTGAQAAAAVARGGCDGGRGVTGKRSPARRRAG